MNKKWRIQEKAIYLGIVLSFLGGFFFEDYVLWVALINAAITTGVHEFLNSRENKIKQPLPLPLKTLDK